jgi:hypothetical protein
MHFKRGKPKASRSGCLMCKPHKYCTHRNDKHPEKSCKIGEARQIYKFRDELREVTP